MSNFTIPSGALLCRTALTEMDIYINMHTGSTIPKGCLRALQFFAVFSVCFALSAWAQPPAFDFEGSLQGWEVLEEWTDNAAAGVYVDDTISSQGYHSLAVETAFPGSAAVHSYITRHDTSIYDRVELDVYLPPDAPGDVSFLIFLQDGQWRWYQTRSYDLSPGEWRTFSASIASESPDWRPIAHDRPWGEASRASLNSIGVVFRSESEYAGTVNIDGVTFLRALFPEHIKNVSRLSVGEKLELTFNLPTTYRNPFDPDEISVKGYFTAPSGKEFAVPGFFYQEYERRIVTDEQGRRLEALDPRGAPCWKVRFTPMEQGTHSYRIAVTDERGVRSTETGLFEVEYAELPGFARTDSEGGKGFVLARGDYLYPVGFNYRSPYDVRYEQSILGRRMTDPQQDSASSNVALDDGTFGYEENLAEMARYCMNMVEIWMAPWWGGLEWSPQRIGYRGIGRYNMRNAWKFDRIMDAAAENEVYVQLLLINHGQLSTWVDAEWQDDPYNVRNGGFLRSPEEVFSDPEARRLIRNKFRYAVARWAYNPYLFSWNPLNEIDLVGDSPRFRRSRSLVDWFREMSAYLKEIDPWQHMVTAHFTENYHDLAFHGIFQLDDIDFTANNAYYNVGREDIATRFRRAYDFHVRFNKPFLINEFGGTPHGSSLRNLKRDLQVGIWGGYTMPMAATPLFWWHQLVRDQDWYHMYSSIVDFKQIVGEARRGMDVLSPHDGGGVAGLHGAGGQLMHCPEKDAYLGWFYSEQYVRGNLHDNVRLQEVSDLCIQLDDVTEGTYRVVIWDPQEGIAAEDREVSLSPGVGIQLPSFTKDLAIFIQRIK